ncbi:cyclic-di-AMP receptor [Globicatella sanguinis]|uniref:cyclic-di-AMP receptor n=1 Tax=Globicatella sanguinis TaxID=13076 RepID=UPI00082556EA|nr:cyclic-di-AMP receptor [Globicatella sanguinis]MDK7630217.1 cyclic-di-AMP receptor [Globicatella sanguinis]WIK67595.1 cyclic-di-AMP receptor [Globicatella sanguinis]WKT57000.1 cyclic-di-AMP receptor [Globicatella sanguinis]
MKLVIAVVQDQDKNILSDAFYEADIRATKLSSTGGFLRSGNTTFMVGIEEDRVDEVLDIIKNSCQSREQFISSPVNLDVSLDVTASYPVKVKVGGATVFVLPIDAFHRF